MAAVDISIEGISKGFVGTQVLKNISLHVAAGEFVTLLGPSGCGKSTLLRIIAGLEQADGGGLAAGGRTLHGIAPRDRDLAFVFQSYALYPHLTVYENIAAPLMMNELRLAEQMPILRALSPRARTIWRSIDDRVRRTAGLLKLEALLNRRPGELSGGQRQRVALGRALVRQPKIFLMDEPLANLDAGLRVHTRSEIARLHRQMGTTTIFVTHDQAEAAALSDRVAVMFGGEIRQFASPVELYRDPVDLDVARFLTQPFMNEITGVAAHDGEVVVGARRLKVRDALGRRSGVLGFRPQHAALSRADDPQAIPGRVARVEHAGTEAHVFLTTDHGELVVRTSAEDAERLRPEAGAGVTIDGTRAWFFPEGGRRDGARHEL